MFLNSVCDRCGEEKLTHHFCKGEKTMHVLNPNPYATEQFIPKQSEIEERCKWFAINQWLSDYPENMSYEDIIERLQLDDWSEPLEETEDEDDEVRIIEWYLLEGHSGDQIAGFIEDTYDSALRLVTGLLTPEVKDEKA